jgi:hypothetical protein
MAHGAGVKVVELLPVGNKKGAETRAVCILIPTARLKLQATKYWS